jgi:hypothetical protein
MGILDGEQQIVRVKRAAYRQGLCIQHETRYTLRTFHRLWRRHGHPGPWVDRYATLCERYDMAVESEQNRDHRN